ncbi:uncharacterized protein EV154DRAFT_307578 [Mucor mucedo]|uniref:uncharacterized protein n=1 Tax=Mucor mucedo TaxID=29922 RepID=UPI00221EDD1A|nr:uncharacterized protein EV154DRAFT_307578 [Mucor mucedo]KAI7888570.1 hypothetical protein EV154DRAFT_307578 [Mucor mucedo]
MDRNDYAKKQMEHFKSFFGHKYSEPQQQQQTESNGLMQESIDNTITSRNAFMYETKAMKAIREFIETEEAYVSAIEDLVTTIMKPIRESIVDPNKTSILDQYSFNRIFINLDDIVDVNKAFLASLKQYQYGTTTETIGQILTSHIEAFNCYKVYLLGKPNSMSCHTENKKQNKVYYKFLVNNSLKKNFGVNDVLIRPVQRMGNYELLIRKIKDAMNSNDPDIARVQEAASKVSNINDMRYGSDSSLLNLYHLIRDAPASLIQTRKLLGYFDASELSLLTGKTSRPVTLLVFTDKIMVVKRKNFNLQSKEYLENIEEKVKVGSTNTILQKAKDVYTGLPLEFKGWVDIRSVEIFNGLKARPDSFFLRTCLPELNPNATEKECENYFRRSDRLFSMCTNSTRAGPYKQKKNDLISLCQKQQAIAKLEDTTELYHEDKFKLPGYSHFYDQDSYSNAEHKNNILIVYIEDKYAAANIDLNSLLTDDVWIVILLTHHESGGYKPTIRSRTSLIPIREISREIEYESIVDTKQRNKDAPLDFIDTLWNNLFFYERRLRATEAYSCVNDNLLRDRARSRSRSKSLTRVASNMSIGKLFARSRSTSPSRHSSSNERTDDDDDQTAAASCVPDPIFKVASVNKHTENEFRGHYAPTTMSHNRTYSAGYFSAAATAAAVATSAPIAVAADKGYKLPRIHTQPHRHSSGPLSEIYVRDDHTFIEPFVGSTNYEDNSNGRPCYNYQYTGSLSSSAKLDEMLFQSSPEHMRRPSSGGSNNSHHSSSASSETDRTPPRGLTMGGSLSSNTSSVLSYFENHTFTPPYDSSYRTNNSMANDERLMSTIDGSRRSHFGGTGNRKTPLHPNLFVNPQFPQHRSQTTPNMVANHLSQFKDEVIGMFDDYVQSGQLPRSQKSMGHYHPHSHPNYDGAQGFKSHLVSKIDKLIEDLHPNQLR